MKLIAASTVLTHHVLHYVQTLVQMLVQLVSIVVGGNAVHAVPNVARRAVRPVD